MLKKIRGMLKAHIFLPLGNYRALNLVEFD